MVDAGAGGELLVAQVRVWLIALLLVIPVVNLVSHPGAAESRIGFGVTLGALLVALGVLSAARRRVYRPWFGFVTSAIDVTLVSLALASFLVVGAPHTAVNSKVIFEVYFLALFATALRYDARVCIVTGGLALAQYAAIVLAAGTFGDLNAPQYAPYPYGMFSWNAQISRLIVLLAAALLSTAIVVRTQKLRQLSTSDRLTGLFNRGYFDARLGAELSRAQRGGRPLALAMLDVDHFKQFNDTHGHAAGDIVLRAIGARLRHQVRRSDIVARYGGEEFVLAFPDTTLADAVEKMESIRAALEASPIRLPRQGVTATITVSAGVAVYDTDAATAEDLVETADERLFQAKAQGRNRVVGPAREEDLGVLTLFA
jgi:diguanylate cyclase (GGDEF)-like protein